MNIMVSADFGIAAQITATIGKRKSFIGTPYWMAPEVACVDRRGGYGVQCDVWAVGITAIELAELQPPLFDLHPMQVLYLMTKSSYKSPTLKDKFKWSPFFHDFVKQCLTKNPKKRPTPDKLLAVSLLLSFTESSELVDQVHASFCLQNAENIQIAVGSSRIESRGRDDPKAASGAIRVSDKANELMAQIWSYPPSTHESASARMRRLYPEVETGARFSLILHDCPVHISSTASSTNPSSSRHFLIVDAEEGIFTLNMDELLEAVMLLVHKRRCFWLRVQKNVLWPFKVSHPLACEFSLLGGHLQDLCAGEGVFNGMEGLLICIGRTWSHLRQRNLTQRIAKPMNKIPEKYIPKKLAITVCLALYKGTPHKYHLHLINFNDESIRWGLSEEHRASATHLDVVALKQID
ncbi:unnamed protein product [Toxocara canis]|uniref:Protein kinase domain-containing protein n=1 Tax=Toxocara canis TaxID=6265 RepID=A0A183V844_TOXCA|nr:unnamed protein product [Toxocara canis]